MGLKQIIEQSDTRAGKVFDIGIQVLIVGTLLVFSAQTLPTLSDGTRRLLTLLEWGAVLVFTAEYIARVAVAEKKLGYVFSFFGIIDLLAILPTYLSLGADLMALRALRVLRVFLILKLVRYTRAVRRFRLAFDLVKEEFVLFGAAISILLFLAATGIYFFEHEAQPENFASVFHSFWWAVVTLTTVGYGDTFPVTIGGRVFTTGIVMIGMCVVAIPAGLFASALHRARQIEADEEEDTPEPHQGAVGFQSKPMPAPQPTAKAPEHARDR